MKKFISVFIVLVIIFSCLSVSAEELSLDSALYLFKNDDLINFPTVQPESIGGVVYIPIRPYAEILGALVEWEESSKSVIITKNDEKIIMKVNENTVVTESNVTMPFTIYTKENTTMCNYIFPASHLGYEVSHIPASAAIARIKDSSANLSDEEIYNKFLEEVRKQEEVLRQREVEKQKEIERQKALEQSKSLKKAIYLTFDDGPNSYTGKILDLLSNYNAKATFFMLSRNMKSNPETVKRIIAEGHAVGLHGVTHDVKKVYSSKESVLDEMNIANSTLENITGQRTLLVRSPYGSKPYMSQEQYDALKSWGYKLWDWNIDSKDSQSSSVSSKTVINHTISQISRFNKPVVLFHDKNVTVNSLTQILEYLKVNNYDMKPLNSGMKPYNFIDK